MGIPYITYYIWGYTVLPNISGTFLCGCNRGWLHSLITTGRVPPSKHNWPGTPLYKALLTGYYANPSRLAVGAVCSWNDPRCTVAVGQLSVPDLDAVGTHTLRH